MLKRTLQAGACCKFLSGGKTRRGANPGVQGTFGDLFGGPTAQMLDVLVLHRGYDLSLKELAEYSGLSSKTVWQNLPNLFRYRLVKRTRNIGNAKMITLDTSNGAVKRLIEVEFRLPFTVTREKLVTR